DGSASAGGRDGDATQLELFPFLDDVDDAVPAVDFSRRGDQRDDVVTNLLNEGGHFDGKAIEELHQHLRASRFRRVNGAGEPINRLGLVNEARTVALGDAARIGKAGRHVSIIVQPLYRILISHRGDNDL